MRELRPSIRLYRFKNVSRKNLFNEFTAFVMTVCGFIRGNITIARTEEQDNPKCQDNAGFVHKGPVFKFTFYKP